MAWISVHEQMKDHPKTRALAREMDCSRHEAIGILVTLWLWAINNADRDGYIQSATAEDIADGIMYRGQSPGQSPRQSAENLLDCLVKSGWIDISGNGGYILHDWDTWQEQWYKAMDKRAKEADKKRAQRQALDQIVTASSGLSPGQSTGQSAGQSEGLTAHNRNRNRNRNQDNNNTPLTPQEGGNVPPEKPVNKKADSVPYEQIKELYNSTCLSLSKIMNIEGARRKAVAARFKTYKTIDVFMELFRKTEASDFLKGNNDKNWTADFDWIMRTSNMPKVLEGKYDNKEKGGQDHGNNSANTSRGSRSTETPTGTPAKLNGFRIAGDDE